MFRRTCGDDARALFCLRARLRVHRAPGFPCALCFLWRDELLAQLGRIRAWRVRTRVSVVIARSERDEAIHSFFMPRYGLLRWPRNDDDRAV